jgi:hypothetical protein
MERFIKKSDLDILNKALKKLIDSVLTLDELLAICDGNTDTADRIRAILTDSKCMRNEWGHDVFVAMENTGNYYVLEHFKNVYKANRNTRILNMVAYGGLFLGVINAIYSILR